MVNRKSARFLRKLRSSQGHKPVKKCAVCGWRCERALQRGGLDNEH